MFGAIIGDIIGSAYEFEPTKSKDFEFYPLNMKRKSDFTDDTVCTIAVAEHLLTGRPLVKVFHEFVKQELKRGYGNTFAGWVRGNKTEPYNSFGNGSAMRVSPVAWFYDSLENVLKGALSSAAVTHDHTEGIKGAEATAAAIFMARTGSTKEQIKNYIEKSFDYNLSRTLAEIRPDYKFEVSCQKSVPEAIICFLESTSFEDAVRNAISLGGDADTQACIAGAIAEAFYQGVGEQHMNNALKLMPRNFREVTVKFYQEYVEPKLIRK